MERRRHILCLFQDGQIPEDAVTYAIERARRTGESISILMLLSEAGEVTLGPRLAAVAARIQAEGTAAAWELHVGSKESGLLKHLALSSTPSAIVWGGDGSVAGRRRAPRAGHWLSNVAPHIHCPIVAPTWKGP